MEYLEKFLLEEALPEPKKIVVSERMLGEDGKPLVWEIRAISEQENRRLKGGEYIEQYWGRLCAACVVTPTIEKKKGKTMEQTWKELLTIGEYITLLQAVQEQNGFTKRKREAKTILKKQFGRA